jgi:hypothetical protein
VSRPLLSRRRRTATAFGLLLGPVLAFGAGGAAVGALRQRVPVQPDSDQARQWAVEELARPEYQENQPGLVERVLNWILDQLSALTLPEGPGSRLGLALFVLALAVGLGLILRYGGGLPRFTAAAGADGTDLFSGKVLDAAGHRAAADRAAAAGDWSAAVLERFRAVVRRLEERAVLRPQPGRTADEVAREAAGWLPDLAGELAAAALIFDDVRYGNHAATEGADVRLRALDDRVGAARPAVQAVATAPGPAVPR